jgi:hypothetical protein
MEVRLFLRYQSLCNAHTYDRVQARLPSYLACFLRISKHPLVRIKGADHCGLLQDGAGDPRILLFEELRARKRVDEAGSIDFVIIVQVQAAAHASA